MKRELYFKDFIDLHYILDFYKIDFNPDIHEYGQDLLSYYFDYYNGIVFINIPYEGYDYNRHIEDDPIKDNRLLNFLLEYCTK